MKKPHTTPIEKEVVLREGEFIVSKTDLKSYITYGNQYFITVSGWKEEELLGKNHNILRHPDMPQSAFKVLYEHIENGKEWFGFVKNLRKDGGYYWVFANISPSYDSNGKMVGYYSVRRKPIDGFKEIIEPLYQSISKIEAEGGMNAGYEEVIKFLNSKKMSFNEFMLAIQKGEINGL
jgi:PAS domain S-box-containing protein